MTILFNEEHHRYFIKEAPERKLTSVSQVFDKVKKKFDSKEVSEKVAKSVLSQPKSKTIKDLAKKWKIPLEAAQSKWGHLEFTAEDFRGIWEEKKNLGINRGNVWHKNIEQELLGRGAKRGTIETTYEGVRHTQSLDLLNLEEGEYVELIIPYLPAWMIGTADRVCILPNKEFTIRDFKTDSEWNLTAKTYYEKGKGQTSNKLLHPLSHLDDCNAVHYNVKESLYIYFLEALGYKFKEGWIDHVSFEDIYDPTSKPTVNIYPITYLRKEVQTLINWFKLTNR